MKKTLLSLTSAVFALSLMGAGCAPATPTPAEPTPTPTPVVTAPAAPAPTPDPKPTTTSPLTKSITGPGFSMMVDPSWTVDTSNAGRLRIENYEPHDSPSYPYSADAFYLEIFTQNTTLAEWKAWYDSCSETTLSGKPATTCKGRKEGGDSWSGGTGYFVSRGASIVSFNISPRVPGSAGAKLADQAVQTVQWK